MALYTFEFPDPAQFDIVELLEFMEEYNFIRYLYQVNDAINTTAREEITIRWIRNQSDVEVNAIAHYTDEILRRIIIETDDVKMIIAIKMRFS